MSTETSSTRLLTDADVHAVFDWGSAVATLRMAYSAPDDPTRYPVRSMARGEGVWLRTLSGVAVDGELMGAKLIAASIRGKRASYLIPLFRQDTAELVALLDGNSITGFRTAATSALAADCLAPRHPLSVAVIGSGFEAKNHLKALSALRTLKRVSVFSPNPESRARFARELADTCPDIVSASSAQVAVADADVVLCAARSRDETPTLYAEGLSPGTTVISIGSTLPEQREVDVSVVAAASVIVADVAQEVAHDTGDMRAAACAAVAFESKIVPLAEVVGGRHPARTSAAEIVLYKSVGAGIQDLAVATMCYARATERGVGTLLPAWIAPVDKGKK
jgi:ornithine cyclodeaminase/alanine dehydrogenase